MSYIEITKYLNNCPTAIRGLPNTLLSSIVALMVVTLQGFGIGADNGNQLGNSLSFGSYKAPSHQSHRGYRYSTEEPQSIPAEDTFSSDREPIPQMDETTPIMQQYFYQPENAAEPEIEPETGWKGYLREKGPSQVIVEIEVEQELKPLSDEVWGLILGTGERFESDRNHRAGKEVVKVDKNTMTIPKTQVDLNKHVVESAPEEPVKMLEEEGEEESPILDDAAESYQQLMELFSRPVFATPSNDFGDSDSMVSFRLPQNQPSPTIRDGSRARFEIRR